MTDQFAFEGRLQDAFDRYLLGAPTRVNAEALASLVVADRPRTSRARWSSWSFGRVSPALRLALLALALLAIASGAILAGSSWLRNTFVEPTPSPSSTPVPSFTEPPSAVGLQASGTIVFTSTCRNVIDASTGELTSNCPQNEYPVAGGGTASGSWAWSPDGQRGIGGGTSSLTLFDAASGARTSIPGTEMTRPDIEQQTQAFYWSPRGTYIVWIGESATPGAWAEFVGPTDDPRHNELPSLGDGSSWCCMLWSTDEQRAIIPTDEQHGRLAAGDGSPLPGALDFDRGEFLAISSDGNALAFKVSRPNASSPLAIDVAIGDGFSPPAVVTSFPDGTYAVGAGWSADGSTLAIATVRRASPSGDVLGSDLWLVGGQGGTRHVPLEIPGPTNSQPRSVTWSADGVHVIVISQEPPESYREWATIVSTLDGRTVAPASAAATFSPDGSFAFFDAVRPVGGNDVDLMIVELATGRTGSFGRFPNPLVGYQLAWLPGAG